MEEMARTLAEYGLWLVFANVLVTQLGAPLPAIPTLIIAGALAQQGHWPAALVVAVAIVASLIGDLPWYFGGRRYGYRVLEPLVSDRDGARHLRAADREHLRALGRRRRSWSPSSCRALPRSRRRSPARSSSPLAPFLVYSAIGAGLWAGVAVVVGVIFHAQVELAPAMGGGHGRVVGARHRRDRVASTSRSSGWSDGFSCASCAWCASRAQELHELMQEGAGRSYSTRGRRRRGSSIRGAYRAR